MKKKIQSTRWVLGEFIKLYSWWSPPWTFWRKDWPYMCGKLHMMKGEYEIQFVRSFFNFYTFLYILFYIFMNCSQISRPSLKSQPRSRNLENDHKSLKTKCQVALTFSLFQLALCQIQKDSMGLLKWLYLAQWLPLGKLCKWNAGISFLCK